MISKRIRDENEDGNLPHPKRSRCNTESSPRFYIQPTHEDVRDLHAREHPSSGWYIASGSIYPPDYASHSFRPYNTKIYLGTFAFDNLKNSPSSVVSKMFHGRKSFTMLPDLQLLESASGSSTLSRVKTNPVLRRSTRNRKPSSSSQTPNDNSRAQNTEEKGRAANVGSSPKDNTQTYCCKTYWPEISCDKEPLIVEEAIKRAHLHLPEEYRHMVLRHLPEVFVWEENEESKTDNVLMHAKLVATTNVSEDRIIDQGRISVVIISRTLQDIEDLTPAQFWKVFWDIVRCLYLLWKLGIAHGDVSITNMMYKEADDNLFGVLNDFSSAAIMEIGERLPKRAGFERMGTVPFMALDLLEYYEGQITRWFRHDLEASTWCLVWRTLRANPSERESWYTGTFEASYAFKNLLFTRYERDKIDSDWTPYFEAIDAWLSVWRAVHDGMALEIKKLPKGAFKFEVRDRADRTDTNESSMRASVEAVVKGITETTDAVKPETVDVLMDTSWIDVQLINVPSL